MLQVCEVYHIHFAEQLSCVPVHTRMITFTLWPDFMIVVQVHLLPQIKYSLVAFSYILVHSKWDISFDKQCLICWHTCYLTGLEHIVHMSKVHSIWHAGIVVTLWTCKQDAQLKWSFYVRVSCRDNLWWILSPFARVAFCELIGHLKLCRSGLSFDFELIYSPSLSFWSLHSVSVLVYSTIMSHQVISIMEHYW